MDPRYTEDEWVAFSRVDDLTDGQYWRLDSLVAIKRVVGPSFAPFGEFVVGWTLEYSRWPNLVGPRRASGAYCYEASSEVVVGYADTAAEAIQEGRDNLALMPPPLWERLIKDGRAAIKQRKAQDAERAAAERDRAMKKQQRLPKRAREVFAASNGACHYCGCALELGGKWHIEHKMPRALKGGSEMHNLVAACVPCNMRKKDKTDLEFQALLATESAIAQASQGGVVGADPSGFDSLDSHGLKHAQPSHSTPLN